MKDQTQAKLGAILALAIVGTAMAIIQLIFNI